MKKGISSVIVFSIIFLVVDQVIKLFLDGHMILNQSNILIKNLLNITLVYNTGAAFSIFMGSRIFLILIGVLSVLGILFYVYKIGLETDSDVFIFSLLLGGILGNLIDRIVHGYVIDYLSFNIGSYYFPVFNFADVCIVFSIILIIIKNLKEDVWKS